MYTIIIYLFLENWPNKSDIAFKTRLLNSVKNENVKLASGGGPLIGRQHHPRGLDSPISKSDIYIFTESLMPLSFTNIRCF